MIVQTKTYAPFVDVGGGVRIYVEDTNSGSAGTIVFIPGSPMGSKVFEYQFQHLVPLGYRCIGIDTRGFGNSDKPWGEYNYDVFVSDIRKALDALDVDSFVMAGHSMGAAISMRYIATQNDTRVKKLVLISPAAPCFTQRDDFPLGIHRAVLDHMINDCLSDRAKLIAKFGESLFAKPGNPTFLRYFHSLAMGASPYATLKCLELLRDTDLRSDMAKINIPALIVHGEQDAITPIALAETLNKAIGSSQLIRIENCGHGPFYEYLAEFNQALIDFVDN